MRDFLTVAGAWRSKAVMEKFCGGPDEVEGASNSFITWEGRLLVSRAPSFSPILCGVWGIFGHRRCMASREGSRASDGKMRSPFSTRVMHARSFLKLSF